MDAAGTRVRFDALTLTWLRAEARASQVSLAEIVRRAVEEYFTARGRGTDLLRDTIHDAMIPHMARLADLSAAAILEGAMAKWLAVAITEHLAQLPREAVLAYPDQDPLLEEIRHYALADLKAHRDAGGGDT